jgi:phospholipid/cholesterol/gamma-HCH transport system substrate-binding protein
MGDYTNLSIRFNVDLSHVPTGLPTQLPTQLPTLLPPSLDPGHVVSLLTKCLTSKDGLRSKACQKLVQTAEGLRKLKKACHRPKNKDAAVCQALNQIPDTPGGGLPTGLPTLLGGLGGAAQGLGRTGFGPTRTADPRGPTMGQLSRMFDPALVRLLVPGMVTTR